VEQIRDRKFEVDKFYEYQKIICLSQTEQGVMVNPLNLLFVIANESNHVKGFLWCSISPLTNELVINSFSMHKDYWCKGGAVQLVESKVKELMKEINLNRVLWITNYPRHSEKFGFKRAKGVLMEYQEEEEDGRCIHGVRCKADGDSRCNDSPTEEFSKQHAESFAGAS
jgi:N-acetylglutamate synthase-like GNAT family acetyltransferase